MVRVTSLILFCGVLTAGAVHSAEQIDFTKYDRNNDALLDPQEWQDIGHLAVDFEEVDRNNDGWANRAEIHSLLLDMRENGQLRIRAADGDDEQIAATGQQADTRASNIAFEDFDLDNDDRVSRREAKLQDVPSIANRFVLWDTDNDRLLDRNEFDRAVADLEPYEVSAGQPITDEDVRDDEFVITDFEMWDGDGDGLLDRMSFERDIAGETVE